MLALTDSVDISVRALSWRHKLGVLALQAQIPPPAFSTRHDHMQKIARAGHAALTGSWLVMALQLRSTTPAPARLAAADRGARADPTESPNHQLTATLTSKMQCVWCTVCGINFQLLHGRLRQKTKNACIRGLLYM